MSGLLARPSFSSSRTLLALITGTAIVAATSFSAITAKAADLIVKYDQSQLLRVARPVAIQRLLLRMTRSTLRKPPEKHR